MTAVALTYPLDLVRATTWLGLGLGLANPNPDPDREPNPKPHPTQACIKSAYINGGEVFVTKVA